MNRKIVLGLIICFTVLGLAMAIKFNQSTRFARLNITQEEWDEIIASRSEDAISFNRLKFNDYDLVIDNNNSKLYYSVVQSSPNKFTPLVSYTSNLSNAKMAILEDEITEDKIQNNHAFQVLLYNDEAYHSYRLYCTSFPMLNIVYSEQDKTDSFNIPMSMYLFNNQDNGINRIARSDGTLNMVEMEDGTTNYRFSLTMTTTGNNERDNVISLLNMQPSNEYFLNAINIGENDSPMSKRMEETRDFSGEKTIDFSGDRPEERFMEFSGEEAENLGNPPMNRKEDNHQRVELFVNNEYIGLYSISYNPDIRIRPRNR